MTVSWTDRRGHNHRRVADRHVRQKVPMSAMVRTDGLDPSLFAARAGDPYSATPLSDAVLICERDPDITGVAVCAVGFDRLNTGGQFVAPIFTRHSNHAYSVVDLQSHRLPAYVEQACRDIGWATATVAMPSGNAMSNMRQLACDRYGWAAHGFDAELERLMWAATGYATTIETLCRAVDRRCPERVRPILNYALWHGMLVTDWDRPITRKSHVIVPRRKTPRVLGDSQNPACLRTHHHGSAPAQSRPRPDAAPPAGLRPGQSCEQ
jgi:hypothetical protein